MNTKALAGRYWPIAGMIILYGVAISLVHFFYADPRTHSGSTLLDLNFGFGSTMQTMLATGKYQTCLPPGDYEDFGDFCYVAGRPPLIPMFLLLMSLLSLRTLPALIVKNIFSFGIIALAVMRHSSFQRLWSGKCDLRTELMNPRALLLCAFIFTAFIVPYNAFVESTLDFEEAYFLGPLLLALAVMFDLRERRGFVLLGVLLGALIYAKASMWPVSITLAVLAAIYSGRTVSWAKRLTPLAILLGVYMAWGGFVYSKTGHFAIGATLSSWGGGQLYRGNNPYMDDIYPKYSVDYPFQARLIKPDRVFENEWQANAYFTAKSRQYIADHPADFVKLSLRKAYVVLFNMRDNGRAHRSDARETINPFLVVDRLIFFAAILACGLYAYRRKVNRPALIISVLAVGTYSAPLIVGYAYNRHVIPVILMVIFSAAWVPTDTKPQKVVSG